MDAALLTRYRLRLANLSQRNRALKLGKLSPQRDVDWFDLAYIEDESADKLLDRVISGKSVSPVKRYYARDERANVQIRRLTQIYRELRLVFEETGSYDLYLGYPFVEGKFLDGTLARCPILLFPLRLVRGENTGAAWTLEPREHGESLFNPTFFRAFEKYNQIKIADEFWDETPPERPKNCQELNNWLYETLQKYQIGVDFNSDLLRDKLWPFRNVLAETMQQFPLGQLKFQPYAVLGVFPQSDSALVDDFRVVEQWPGRFAPERIFAPRTPAAETPAETDRYFPLDVDGSQEAALLAAKQGANLVVHGPPGSGKSQLIVNLVADYLARGRQVLVVSQKRAALDVVHKRLAAIGLEKYCALVHDYEDDRPAFYKLLSAQIQALEAEAQTADLPEETETRFLSFSEEIDELTQVFDAQYEAVHRKLPCGLSPYQLYLKVDFSAKRFLPANLPLKLTTADVERFFVVLQKLRFYRECLLPAHPWYFRPNFAQPERLTLARLRDRLTRLETEYAAAAAAVRKGTYQKKFVLENEDLAEQIAQFRRLKNELEASADLWQNFIYYLSGPKLTNLQADWKEIDRLHKHLGRLKYFRFDDFSKASELLRCLNTIDETDSFFQKLFSGKRSAAQKTVKSHLARFGSEMNETTLAILRKEIATVQEALDKVADFADRPFWSDLLDVWGLPDAEILLESKKEYLAFLKKWDNFKVFPAMRPTAERGKLMGWEETCQFFDDLEASAQLWKETVKKWKQDWHENQADTIIRFALKGENITVWTQTLDQSLAKDFEDLLAVDDLFSGLNDAQRELYQSLETDWLADKDDLYAAVWQNLYAVWLEDAERNAPALRKVSERSFDFDLERLRALKDEKQRLLPAFLPRRLKRFALSAVEYNRAGTPVNLREILHQVTKKRQIWPIRKLTAKFWNNGLSRLAPCVLASPETVSAIFPMEPGLFDLIIFDEASQCPAERAFTIALRGRQMVVAGDEKQLPPMDLFRVKAAEDETEEDPDIAAEAESLLQLAEQRLQHAPLRWHYRSRHEALIHFSNHAFYQGHLQMLPPAMPDKNYNPPIAYHHVGLGKWENNANVAEAWSIVARIEELLARPEPPTLGVVTFNYHQQQAVLDAIDARLNELREANDEDGVRRILEAFERKSGDEFEGLFVKNIENVQGDERDVIIFSIGYAPDETGKMAVRFGWLNQQGGENRLNVAITRARRKIDLFVSFLPEQLDVENAKHNGPRLLKKYLQYANLIASGRVEEAYKLAQTAETAPAAAAPPNPVADALSVQLTRHGFTVKKNAGASSVKIDLAVSTAESQTPPLAVLCESPVYQPRLSAADRLVYRRRLLEHSGWKAAYVWARNWALDREGEVRKVVEKIK